MYTGCKHYTRKCLLRASCCGEVFACRFCHDEAKCEEVPEPSQRHRIDRHSVSSVICGGCGHEQKPSQDCERCGERSAVARVKGKETGGCDTRTPS